MVRAFSVGKRVLGDDGDDDDDDDDENENKESR